MPPLGLITIAAMTPETYEIRLIDLNCETLAQADLEWADVVCFSAMLPQRPSLFQTAQQCQAAGKLIVFGGPYPTACPEECTPYCDVLVLNQGEITWRDFLKDVEQGTYRSIYTTTDKPDVTQNASTQFQSTQDPRLRGHPGAVLTRLPIPVRVLRHHCHVRPPA